MELSIVGCLFVLDTKKNENKKKNDIKTLKIVVDKTTKELIRNPFDSSLDIKDTIRNKIEKIIGSSAFHLEQVYTVGESKFYEDNKVDIIYMALTNKENIKNLDDNYELLDFEVLNNNQILFGNQEISYQTEKKIISGSLEYYHQIKVDSLTLEKELLELLIAFKQLRFKMDNTDVCFKLLPRVFTLEDVRIAYELIKGIQVDKSNFRKKIIKYCEKVDMTVTDKGYRPSQLYKFNPTSVDTWL